MNIHFLVKVTLNLSLLITLNAQSADLASLSRMFKERFTIDWVENKCGENTARFVKAAHEKNIDLSRSVIIGAEDVMGYFGLISGYQSREGGPMIRPEPKQPPFHLVGRSNWYFHAFLVAQETVNSKKLGEVIVFDLSFKNDPTLLNLTRYLDEMYIPEKTPVNTEQRNRHLKTFRFSIYDARTYVTKGQTASKIREDIYLRDLFPSYYSTPSPIDTEFFDRAL